MNEGRGTGLRWAVVAAGGLAWLGLASGTYEARRAAGPAGGEATVLGMTASLWHDRDLVFDHRDLSRAHRVWDMGPRGVALAAADGGAPRYAAPLAYPLAALPAYALAGPRGVLVGNAALYLLVAGVGWRLLVRGRGWGGGGNGGWAALAAAGFFFASASAAYAFRLGEEVFLMACAFLPLALARILAAGGSEGSGSSGGLRARRSPAWGLKAWGLTAWGGAGALAASGALSQPLLVLFAVPVVVELALDRRRQLAAFAAGGLAAAIVLAALGERLTGSWRPDRAGPRAVFEESFPVGEEEAAAWRRAGESEIAGEAPFAAPPPRSGFQGVGWFLFGRHAGLVPYFPFALVALACGVRNGESRRRQLLFAAAVLFGLAAFLLPPAVDAGSPADRRLAAAYPALLPLVAGRKPRWSLLLPFAAAGLWTLPALARAVALPPARQAPVEQGAAFRPLPPELDLLAAGALPGYAGRAWDGAWWIVPTASFFVEDEHPGGVWVRGASSARVVVAAPRPLEGLSFHAHSLAGAENRLRLASGAGSVTVVFDSLAKQQGTRVALPLEPIARAPGTAGAGDAFFYAFDIEVASGEVARRHYPGSRDGRYLGVFLDFTGTGLDK